MARRAFSLALWWLAATRTGLGLVEESLARFRDGAPAVSAFAAERPTRVSCSIASADASGARGTFRITVRPDWSAALAAAFVERVDAGFYDGCFFFRVLPGFIAQFGIKPEWAGPKWSRPTPDAPGPGATNVRGTIAFAGGAHPTQLFVNLGDNSRLDRERTVPFAQVDDAGMAVLDRIYTGYKEGSGQVAAYQQGVDELQRQFPRMSWIERCAVEAATAPSRGDVTS